MIYDVRDSERAKGEIARKNTFRNGNEMNVFTHHTYEFWFAWKAWRTK